MTTVTIFGITLTFNKIAFTIPIGAGWDVYWYGIIIGLGCLLALLFGMKNAERFNLDRDRMLDVVLVTIPVAILCARAYYCLFDSPTGIKISNLKEFFGFDGSGFAGLAIYGGIIGAFICGAIMCKLRKVNILDMFDIAALGFLIGQGIGRWGNFINQEAFGLPTGSDWFGMKSFETGNVNVHPCFLYESIWCIAGFFILNHFSKKRKFSGETALMYGVWYGFGRFFIESIRTDQLTIGKIPVSMLVSAIIFIACLVLLVYFSRRKTVEATTAPYESLFREQMDDYQETEEEETSEITEETTESVVETAEEEE